MVNATRQQLDAGQPRVRNQRSVRLGTRLAWRRDWFHGDSGGFPASALRSMSVIKGVIR